MNSVFPAARRRGPQPARKRDKDVTVQPGFHGPKV